MIFKKFYDKINYKVKQGQLINQKKFLNYKKNILTDRTYHDIISYNQTTSNLIRKEVFTMTNATEKKLTKREMFNRVIELAEVAIELEMELDFDATEVIDFAEHEIEMLDKKASSKSAKDKEKEKADEVLISIILETLLGSAGMTASEILKANANREEFADVSNQKVSALLKKLVDRDSVKKFTDKRKSYFHLA